MSRFFFFEKLSIMGQNILISVSLTKLTSDFVQFCIQTSSIWGIKHTYVVCMHDLKMCVKYCDIILTASWLLGLLWCGTHRLTTRPGQQVLYSVIVVSCCVLLCPN
jgi:hypothetical protein